MSGNSRLAGRVVLASAFLFAFLLSQPGAQYWFQSGAQGSYQSEYNSGASVQIMTVSPQPAVGGSLAYWVGETLYNGAFVQVGYEVPNQSGDYPNNCSQAGCTGKVHLEAGQPVWFWEYFPAGYNSTQFFGSIGQVGSAGANGTFNTYSFQIANGAVSFYFNGTVIGNVNLGAASAGNHVPIAVGEYAGVDTNTNYMPAVQFKNLRYYNGTGFVSVPEGYSLVGYGVGSEKTLPSTYGVQEVGNNVNYFEVGSGIPVNTQTQVLWGGGFQLNIVSAYGGLNSSTKETQYSTAQISAPKYVNITSGERAYFNGWVGAGSGSYTGKSTNASVRIQQNVTEQATWRIQYLLNATSQYGTVAGAGWYFADGTASLNITPTVAGLGDGKRALFNGWSNGEANSTLSLFMDGPINISALWSYQYLVNATSQYGGVSGSGWYDANSTAGVSLNETSIDTGNGTRLQFVSWSDGTTTASQTFTVTGPVFLSARFDKEYLTQINFVNAYGSQVAVQAVQVGGIWYNSTSVFVDPLGNTTIGYVRYDGTLMDVNYTINGASAGMQATVKLQLYNVTIFAHGIFGLPASASATLKFGNGTTGTFQTGPGGAIELHNVPYGTASGTVSYDGNSQNVNVTGGASESVTFVTPTDIGIIVAIAVVAALLALWALKRKR